MTTTATHPVDAAWIGVRFAKRPQRCHLCGAPIKAKGPGSCKGTRDAKAWWNPLLKLWECLGCRLEGQRAEEARRQAGLP